MEFFKHNTQINFMAQRKGAAILSLILFFLSLLSLFMNHLHLGLDFTGGTQAQLSFTQPADLNQIRDRLQNAGFTEAIVNSYGTSKDVLVSLVPKKMAENNKADTETNKKDEIVRQISSALPDAKIQQVDYVGPQVGQELATKGALAVVIALLGTMIYIALRFEWRFAISSTVALIHDPVLILGIFSFFHLEFNLIALAALLTVIGYSLNDTIVIFDRIRENFRKMRKATSIEVINQSINQTLSRTIMTSALALLVVLALFFLGGSMLHGFALAMIIGIVVGTYSSIYVAGSLSLFLKITRQHLLPVTKEILDSRP
ncbi:MAG: secF [Gammaproteobacteria bacterium]|jgi:preprotein translocase subunit SecF|nr:secF [Gammaproteobacteria bacterium]MCE3238837.1 secF [Gammaproteobacteria bacterium]